MLNPNLYFYSINREHYVCADKQEKLYSDIMFHNATVKELYETILETISLIDREHLNLNRELDSKISLIYTKIKEELDAMASTDI